MTNAEIATAFEEIATLYRLQGANDFKSGAWDKGARLIEQLDDPIMDHVAEGTHTDLKGIGKSLAAELEAAAESGTFPTLEALREAIPTELVQWLEVPGLGPKTAYKIHDALDITHLDDLKSACLEGRVAELPGLGQKKADKIAQSIDWITQHAERCTRPEAVAVAETFSQLFKEHPEIDHWSVAGSLRRGNETIGDIDLLAALDDADATRQLMQKFTEHPEVTEVLATGDSKSSVRTRSGRQVDLRLVEPRQYGAALMYFTGSKEHNVLLRGRARDQGMALNEYGLFKLTDEGDTDFEAPVATDTEEAIYSALQLPYVPPELREDHGEFEWLESHAASDLVALDDLKGLLHAHSTWSDGGASIEEMARACMDAGYTYLGLTDHSRTAAYAGGLSIEALRKQGKEVDEVNAKLADEGHDFVIFKGVESDILPDGSLDYPDEVLATLDFVIGSVHAQLDMAPDNMLARYLTALDNPYLRIIGHPTGRLLLKREGNTLDLKPVIDRAAEQQVAIEINAHPRRLDLDWRYGGHARKAGLVTCISPDAHSPEGLTAHLAHGIAVARKAGFRKEDVLNTRSAEELRHWFARD